MQNFKSGKLGYLNLIQNAEFRKHKKNWHLKLIQRAKFWKRKDWASKPDPACRNSEKINVVMWMNKKKILIILLTSSALIKFGKPGSFFENKKQGRGTFFYHLKTMKKYRRLKHDVSQKKMCHHWWVKRTVLDWIE